jgi:hypothetical protein
LQATGSKGDAGTAGAQHLREKILSKRQPSGADAIVAHEQPSGEALIDSVKTVAGGNLHQLDSGDLGKTA